MASGSCVVYQCFRFTFSVPHPVEVRRGELQWDFRRHYSSVAFHSGDWRHRQRRLCKVLQSINVKLVSPGVR